MEIQKERKAFETWLFSTEKFKFRNKNFLFMLDEYGNYEDKSVLEHWETWQAAKAQAVPEGFKVVSFKQISELVVAVNKVDLMTHTEQKTNEVRLAWQDIASKLQAVIEVQEQKG